MVRRRLKILACLLFLPFGVIVWRLQVLQLDPARVSSSRLEAERRSYTYTSPRRGRILDRHGVVLAGNRPAYQLCFHYADLNARREPLEILVEELKQVGGFPGVAEVEASLLEAAGPEALLAEEDARMLSPTAALAGGGEEWLPLVTGLGKKLAGRIEQRWISHWRREPAGAARVLELRPEVGSETFAVWFDRRGALRLELTLERVARLLRIAGLGEQRGTLHERLAAVERQIESLVNNDLHRDRAEDSGAIPGEIVKKERSLRRYQRRQSRVLVSDVPLAVVTEVEYHGALYPGIHCVDAVEREYPLGEACGSITGWLGRLEARKDQLAALKAAKKLLPAPSAHGSIDAFVETRAGKLRSSDWIGDTGLEAQYDEALRGSAGLVVERRDSRGRPRQRVKEVPPENGRDIRTTLDAALQRRLHETLVRLVQPLGRVDAGTAGSAAVMELPSGALLASVGFPGADPNRMREKNYLDELEARWGAQTKGWLLDRPSSWPLDPGSVFKVIVAAAAMESASPWEGPFSEERRYPCHHKFELNPGLRCNARNGHTASRTVNLAEALQFSCNNFFYYAGILHLKPQLMEPWALNFGYGRPTGIDFPARYERNLLTPAHKIVEGWKIGHYAIGQGFVRATPLQVLRSYAALAVGGESVPRPYLVEESTPDNLRLANPRTVPVIRDGLWRVGHAEQGTASHERMRLSRFNAAFKTGTAEVTTGEGALHNGWIAGWAPFDSPRIAFVAVIERTPLHGGDAAAPLIAAILEHFAAEAPELYLVGGGGKP